ncbi:hypothetical protein TWF506_010650 [Arthrobotrys conoides]|uniref:Uncharacterized protein n=1 Tax=Arthrobotrys conoides TaxID=74498 RepID=A0AAN8NE68_9PEZI
MQTPEDSKDLSSGLNSNGGKGSPSTNDGIGFYEEKKLVRPPRRPPTKRRPSNANAMVIKESSLQQCDITVGLNRQSRFGYNTPSYSPESLENFHLDQIQNTTPSSSVYPPTIPSWKLAALSSNSIPHSFSSRLSPLSCEPSEETMEDDTLTTLSTEISGPTTGPTSQHPKLFLEDHRGIYFDSSDILTPPTSSELYSTRKSRFVSGYPIPRRDYGLKKKETYTMISKLKRRGESGHDTNPITPPESLESSGVSEIKKEDETPGLFRDIAPPEPCFPKRQNISGQGFQLLSSSIRNQHHDIGTSSVRKYEATFEETVPLESRIKEPNLDLYLPQMHTPRASSPSFSPMGDFMKASTEISSHSFNLSYRYRIPDPTLGRNLLGSSGLVSRALAKSVTYSDAEVPTYQENLPWSPFSLQPIKNWESQLHFDEGYQSLEPTLCYAREDALPAKYIDNTISKLSSDTGVEIPEPTDVTDITSEIKLPPSTEEDDSGYQEEKSVKVVVLYILIQYFLLREYHLKSKSASTTPGSRSSSSAENDSDSQFEQSDNLEDQGDNKKRCASYAEGSGSGISEIGRSQTQESHLNSQKRKRDDRDDRDKGDEDDQRSNKKRSKHVDLNSLGSRLACPYAKGKPSSHLACVLIGRQDLAGVKEHLKRNHFEKKLPPEIRACKTWDQVFRVCITDWDYRNPIPSPYLNIGYEILRPITGLPSPAAKKLPPSYETPQHQSLNSAPFGSIASPTAGPPLGGAATVPRVPSVVNQPPAIQINEGIVQAENPYFAQPFPGEPQNSMGDTPVENNPETIIQPDLTSLFDFPEDLDGWLKSRAEPHIPWPPGAEFTQAFDSVPELLLNNYGIDVNTASAELYPVLQNELGIPPTDSPYLGTAPSGTSASSVSPASNSSVYTPVSAVHSGSGISMTTAISTPSAPITEPVGNRYTLLVARKHPVAGSMEAHGPKEFEFDSYETFKLSFERWILATFIDPLFSWDTMEFLGANPEITSRLSDMNQVLMDIRMHNSRYRTTEATLLLVSKDKGKQMP